jgi:hypothetical protein
MNNSVKVDKDRSKQQASKDARPAQLAWEEGKAIQYATYTEGKWIEYNTSYQDLPAFARPNLIWRVKPTPNLRPWTRAEIPVGAIMCFGDRFDNAFVIIGISGGGRIQYMGESSVTSCDPANCIDDGKFSRDGGKTWHPCGVME